MSEAANTMLLPNARATCAAYVSRTGNQSLPVSAVTSMGVAANALGCVQWLGGVG